MTGVAVCIANPGAMLAKTPKPLSATSPGGGSVSITYPVADSQSHQARVSDARTEERGSVVGRTKRICVPTPVPPFLFSTTARSCRAAGWTSTASAAGGTEVRAALSSGPFGGAHFRERCLHERKVLSSHCCEDDC